MEKILIIEDDKIVRSNICEFLTEEGYEVITADNGLNGVQEALKHSPDLILCDIIMPKMDGYNCFKTIQQLRNSSTVPFIFISGKAEKGDERMGMQMGIDDYITKPFDFNELLKTIKVRLEKHKRVSMYNDDKFYALIDNPTAGVFILQNDKFLFVNNYFIKLFGIQDMNYKTLSFENILFNKPKEIIRNKISNCLDGLQHFIHETIETCTPGYNKKNIVELNATLVNYKGFPSLIGNAINVTRTKKEDSNLLKMLHNNVDITELEVEVLNMISKGLSTQEAAAKLGTSKRTVDTHHTHLLDKSGCKNTTELIMYGISKNLIKME
jgi:PAS domain S-box-containing protein